MQMVSHNIYQTTGVFCQPCAINFFHASIAASILSSFLVVKTVGSLLNTPTIFPESINIYSKNLSLFCLFFANLLTIERFGFISQKCSVTFNRFYVFSIGAMVNPLLTSCS